MRITQESRWEIELGLGKENPILITRRPTPEEKEVFLAARFALGSNAAKARIEFMDTILIGCEKLEVDGPGGEAVPITPATPNWKREIDPAWKTSVISQQFEERPVAADDAKKSGPR